MPGFSWRVKQYASARMAVGIKKRDGKKRGEQEIGKRGNKERKK